MIPKRTADRVRALLAEHFNNPRRQAARDARAKYISELIAANLRGDDVDREAADWLRRLTELCGPHAEDEDVARWYANERARLLKLTDGEERSGNDPAHA
jgi:hypothetical protein